MRLLKISSIKGDEIDFEIVERKNEQYCILSRTWSKDPDEELLFEDMKYLNPQGSHSQPDHLKHKTARSKPG
jgi:hypothetical protein